jgi:hypothetical protein
MSCIIRKYLRNTMSFPLIDEDASEKTDRSAPKISIPEKAKTSVTAVPMNKIIANDTNN